MMRVRVAEAASGRVALWERHPDHPGGEVFLAGAGVFEVAATPAVEARLRKGVLVAVEEAAVAPPAKRAEPEPKSEPEPEPVASSDEEEPGAARPKRAASKRGRSSK